MKKIIAVLMIAAPVFAFAQLSTKEQKIAATVEANEAEGLKLLKETMLINSGTMNFEGVRKVGMVYIEELKKLGFEAEFVDGKAWGRAGHLVAVHESKKNTPRLLLIGHLDTVFEPNSPFQDIEDLGDNKLKGPGIADMKGGDVMIIEAVKALKAAGHLKNMNIEIVMTGDEEKSGKPYSASKGHLIEAAKRCDIAIGFENGDSNPKTAVVARRGAINWRFNVTGVPAHSSQVFTERIGAGAIYETARILDAFYNELSGFKDLTFNPGVILGGTQVEVGDSGDEGSAFGKTNVVAETVYVRGDIRAISTAQLDSAKQMMEALVAKNYPKTSASISFSDGYPPMSPNKENYQLLEVYSKASEDLGYGEVTAVNPRDAGAADISFTAGYVKQGMDGVGLSGGKSHTVEEYGDLNWFVPLTQRAAIMMYRLTK